MFDDYDYDYDYATDQTMYQILDKKTKNPRRNLPEALLMRGLAGTHLRSLQPSPRPPGRI